MNQILGKTAIEEIRTAMTGLSGKAASSEAVRLATIYNVSHKHIYGMTRDLRAGRKKRSDAGKRKFDLVEGTDTFEAAALVVGAKLDPDQALLTARANGHENLPTLATMQRLLREKQLSGKQRKYGRRTHRSFEAAAPLDLIQIDCTALKIRWQDVNTRRILRIEGIDKNHPQMDTGKLRVWQIMAVDDHSRRKFLRYVATSGSITSRDMVMFCCDLFCEWGLAKKLYTDNGSEFKGFFAKAIKILSSIPAIAETGGCEHIKHWPKNAQATGKCENAHKWAEKMDRYVGLAEQKGIEVTVDKLDGFAEAICRNYNQTHVHRSTGQTPVDRWFGTQVMSRMLPAEVIKSALLFDEAERVLTAAMTVRVGKVDYKIPAVDEKGNASPFTIGMKLLVVVPHELDKIFVTLPNGEEYDIDKVIDAPAVAGDIAPRVQDEAEILTKQLKKHHAAQNKAAKEKLKQTGEVYQVPHFNHEIEIADTNVRHFPQPSIAITPDDIAAATPVPMDAVAKAADSPLVTRHSSPAYTGKPIGYWAAVSEYRSRFSSIEECKGFLEVELFPAMQGNVPSTEVEAAIDRYFNPGEEALRLVG